MSDAKVKRTMGLDPLEAGRPAGVELTARKRFSLTVPWEQEAPTLCRSTREPRAAQGQKEPGLHRGSSLSCGFAGKASQGLLNSLGLASLNNCRRL